MPRHRTFHIRLSFRPFLGSRQQMSSTFKNATSRCGVVINPSTRIRPSQEPIGRPILRLPCKPPAEKKRLSSGNFPLLSEVQGKSQSLCIFAFGVSKRVLRNIRLGNISRAAFRLPGVASLLHVGLVNKVFDTRGSTNATIVLAETVVFAPEFRCYLWFPVLWQKWLSSNLFLTRIFLDRISLITLLMRCLGPGLPQRRGLWPVRHFLTVCGPAGEKLGLGTSRGGCDYVSREDLRTKDNESKDEAVTRFSDLGHCRKLEPLGEPELEKLRWIGRC